MSSAMFVSTVASRLLVYYWYDFFVVFYFSMSCVGRLNVTPWRVYVAFVKQFFFLSLCHRGVIYGQGQSKARRVGTRPKFRFVSTVRNSRGSPPWPRGTSQRHMYRYTRERPLVAELCTGNETFASCQSFVVVIRSSLLAAPRST